MKKKFKNTKFIIAVMIIFSCMVPWICNNIVKASEVLPEIEVEVNYTGIKTSKLNQKEKNALKKGIEVKDEDELYGILENYSS